MTQKEIQVYAHWQGFDNPVMMGVLHTTPTRGKEIFSFEYGVEIFIPFFYERKSQDLK